MKTNSLEYLKSLPKWGRGSEPKLAYWRQMAEQTQWYDGDGDWLEFGVYKGDSAECFLSRMPRKARLYLFDSWEGLPEDWVYGPEKTVQASKEWFALSGGPPTSRFQKYGNRAVFVKGLFQKTIPKWKRNRANTKISVIHLDADIYSSTKYVLDTIDDMITSDTLVMLDDYYGRPANMDNVHKAFHEYIDKNGYDFTYLARYPTLSKVALKIIK